MASVIVVENDLKDSVRQYSQIIDSVHGNTEFSDSLSPYIEESITDRKTVLSLIIKASTKETLTSLSNKEFEPTFYALAYLINELEGSSFEQILQKDSFLLTLLANCVPQEQPSLRDRKSLRATTLLSAFNTLFNLLPPSSPNRIHIIESILDTVSRANISFSLIASSIGDHLVAWLRAANASEAHLKQLFWKFIAIDSEHTLKSLNLIKTFTSEFTLNAEELRTLIKFALNSDVVDVLFLVNNNVASALAENANDELVKVFVDYTRGKFISSVPLTLPSSVVEKSRILALAAFFVSTEDSRNTFKYSDVPSELAESPATFEKLLIDSIKAGVIEGKLNQVDETFYLVRANRFILAGDDQKLAHDWEVVKSTLWHWKNSLENIKDIVSNAKENIVNNSNSN